jgi:hypothetical protein
MASDLESASSAAVPELSEGGPRWVRVGFVALASALAGGLAAAWWYRKTLATLREAEKAADDPHFRILDD